MASYLSLEEAAAKLGIPADRLVELRSQGEIRGFRDGSSWKFPDTEIDRLADELGDMLTGGSGVLATEGGAPSGGSKVIGGDAAPSDGSGSDLELGLEAATGGSDVNLIASESNGSDVELVAKSSGSDDLGLDDQELAEIDSKDLKLEGPALTHDSAQLDLGEVADTGSTGPITDEELKEAAGVDPASSDAGDSASSLSLGCESDELKLQGDSDLSFGGSVDEQDSDDEVIGASDLDMLSDDSMASIDGDSNLSLMSDESIDSAGQSESAGSDVLSELDLLSAQSGGSGLIAGDSDDLVSGASGGALSGGSASEGSNGDLSSIADDALDDDDLVIAENDDDLVISSGGSDISIAGDSGINLMSPSDSGLSLESEPLDLAGSSISALDLGAEIGSGIGSGSGSGKGDGSAVDFADDEEFQLSPSGVGLEADDSGSQVIEVEDSEAIAEPVEFGDDAFGDAAGGDVFADAEPMDAEPGMVAGDGMEAGGFEAEPMDEPAYAGAAVGGAMGYDVPFTTLQVVSLLCIIGVMSLGGMLMTDLVRNMWAYAEPAAPVSSLTDSLVNLMGWGR
ncbi:MAG: helix-turn-helix domain-containing protein [Planctomycetota bacterium]